MRHFSWNETQADLAAHPWPYALIECGYCQHRVIMEATRFPPGMIMYKAPLACSKCGASHSKHDRAIFIYCPERDEDRERFLGGAGPDPATHHRHDLGR
jgi:DNA-directed RNA polymerase subunit RPC12/RpoP